MSLSEKDPQGTGLENDDHYKYKFDIISEVFIMNSNYTQDKHAATNPLHKSTSQPKFDSNKYRIIILFIIAGLFVLLCVLYGAKTNESKYELSIKEIGSESMLAISDSEELGLGEILLLYDEDMVIEDINGQIIDLGELSAQDRIRVFTAKNQKGENNEPFVEKIVLLPVANDEYV